MIHKNNNNLVIIGLNKESQRTREFLNKLGLSDDDVYFLDDVQYEKISAIKPLIIMNFSAAFVNKLKIKCPIINLSVSNSSNEMYEELKKETIHKRKYDYFINFKLKNIFFSTETAMLDFISSINNMKIVEIDIDSSYGAIALFNSNKKTFKVQFIYENYCYVKCGSEESEKISITGHYCRKFHYVFNNEVPKHGTFEKDIHQDYRFIIDYFEYFEPATIEDLNYLTYDIETNKSVDVVNTPGEIISIVYLLNDKYEFLMFDNKQNNFEELRKQEDVKIFDTEKEMLCYFSKIFSSANIVTGFNINGFDNIYLVNRAKKLGLNSNDFSPIKRISNKIVEEKDRMNPNKFKIYGLSLIDTMIYAKDKYFIYSLDKPSQYNLDYLGKFLKLGTKVHDDRGPYTLWLEDPQKLYEYNIQDVKLCRQIEDKIGMINYLLSFKKLISTFNIQWSLYNSKIIDFFMLCNFSKDYVFPNKYDNEIEILEGAYVKEPLSGIYDNVAVFDFAALYPNIIRQFNISYETVFSGHKEGDCLNIDLINNDDLYKVNIEFHKKGIMPKIVDKLIFMKNDLSKQMSESSDPTLPIKYNAIKAVINGIYGVSKYKWFRLYNINCARLITFLARTLIKKVEENVDSKENFISIYGDTDSIFIHNKLAISYSEAKKDFEQLAPLLDKEVSKFILDEYKLENKYLHLEFETLFNRLLMTKSKKKYYGNGYFIKGKSFDELKEYGRGVDIVKKDTPTILRPLLKQLLVDIITRTTDKDIKDSIINIKKEIFKLNYKDLLITKQISRDLDDYKVTPQHVRAMKYSNANLGTDFSRANYKGGMLYVIHPQTDVIMLANEMKLPEHYVVNYNKYFELFVENKVSLFMDDFKKFFNKNHTLDEWSLTKNKGDKVSW